MQVIQPFVDWANSVLSHAEDGVYVPPDGSVLKFQTTIQPVWNKSHNSIFEPGEFEPTDNGLIELIANTVEHEMDANPIESTIFAKNALSIIRQLEQYEHWIEEVLTPSEMKGMHYAMHKVLYDIAEQNEDNIDVEKWKSDDDKLTVDRLLLAIAYILAWQPYGISMQFVWSLSKPWYVRLSEVVSQHIDNPELFHISQSLKCLKDRVHHFDNLLYSYLEGSSSLEDNEDISADDDLDAVEMYHDKKTIRDQKGNILNAKDESSD